MHAMGCCCHGWVPRLAHSVPAALRVRLQSDWHAGLLDASAACPKGSQGPAAEAAGAGALWQATMQDLSAVWPSLPQRLLARAVQHIAGVTCRSLPTSVECM